jgi:hypothetical protein
VTFVMNGGVLDARPDPDAHDVAALDLLDVDRRPQAAHVASGEAVSTPELSCASALSREIPAPVKDMVLAIL